MSTPRTPKQLPVTAAATIVNALMAARVAYREDAANVPYASLAAQFDAQAAACTALLEEIAGGDALFVDQSGDGEGAVEAPKVDVGIAFRNWWFASDGTPRTWRNTYNAREAFEAGYAAAVAAMTGGEG